MLRLASAVRSVGCANPSDRVVYEVRITLLEPTVKAQYVKFLFQDGHIDRVLGASPGFLAAEILDDAKTSLSVRYTVRSQADLDRYLAEQAPALQQEAKEVFPCHVFRTERSVWKSLHTFYK